MTLHIADSHCHLNFEDFENDIPEVISRARTHGVSPMITICTKWDEIETLLKIVDKESDIFASVGIHPHEAEETLKNHSADDIYNWLLKHAPNPKIVAIGETGLDFYYEHSPKELQKEVFEAHLKAASQTGLPLSIHTRSAEQETIAMMEPYKDKVHGVIHCFSGSQYLADEALRLGFDISLSGILTFKKAQDIRDVVQTVPINRLVLETDSPYLAPMPHRGKRNEPVFVKETAKFLADMKGITLEELAPQIMENFYRIFPKARGL